MSTITIIAPERSLQQRLDALARGNEHRLRRAELKRDMKARRKTASQILAAPPEWAQTMKIADLLMAVPRWGCVKAQKELRRNEVNPNRSLGGLTPRQRSALLAALHGA